MADKHFPNPFATSTSTSTSSSTSTSTPTSSSTPTPTPTSFETVRDVCAETTEQVYSGEGRDYTVYTGIMGAALTLLALDQSGVPNTLRRARKLAKKARSVVMGSSKSAKRITFHEGVPGVYAGSAVIEYRAGKVEKAQGIVEQLLAFADGGRIEEADSDEILYGRSGYLLALLYVREGGLVVPEEAIRDVANMIVRSGRRRAEKRRRRAADEGSGEEIPPLLYAWHKKEYLGAAHGMAGILYVLLHARDVLEDDEEDDVRDTLLWLVDQATESGNFPSSLGKKKKNRDRLVQWCHGAPGLVHVLTTAASVYPENEVFASAALACGDVIWHRGLLRKAPGLCHGIAGNGFGLLRLYRFTGDNLWLERAQKFLLFAASDEYQHAHAQADNPASLFQGEGGLAAFAAAVLAPDKDVRFPGFALD